jgi:mono/diheme cytochrome c family protein
MGFEDLMQSLLRTFDRTCFALTCGVLLMSYALTACTVERRKSDAELGLTPQQAAGRRVYDNYCDRCHEPYSSREKKGPSLQATFKHQYLPKSGLPANDEQVGDIIRLGRGNMPAYGPTLTQQQFENLMAFMHTL